MPCVVDEEAAVGVAVPGDPQVGAGLQHALDDQLAVLRQQRVGLVVGEGAVRRPIGLDQLQLQALQQRADHRAGHAVATVDDDLQRPGRRAHDVGVDELHCRRLKLPVEIDLLERSARSVLVGRGVPVGGGLRFCFDRAANVLDSRVARQRQCPLTQELCAGVAGRIVRGGAHQAAVQLARSNEVVEHLASDLAGIDHVDTGPQQALAIAGRQLRGGQAHVVTEADSKLRHGLAGQAAEHVRERAADPLGDVAVDLLAVQAADVVGLEDLRCQ